MLRIRVWLLLLFLGVIFNAPQAQGTVLRLGHDQPNASPYHKGAVRFAELVNAKTGGKLKVDIYGGALIDHEAGLARRIYRGSLDMAVLTGGNLTVYNPDFLIFDLPYLFEDYAHVERVLSGEVGRNLASRLESRGLKILSWWESGFRHFANNVHPVREPEDLLKLTIATPNWPGAIDTADANGGISRPMPVGDFYEALKNNTADGVEGPIFAIRSRKLYEFQKYLTLDSHTYMPAALIINARKFKNLPSEFQTALTQAAEEAGFYQRRTVRDQVEEDLRFLVGPGNMRVFRVTNKEPWIRASRRVYETLSSRVNKKLVDKVRSLAAPQ